MPPASYWPRRTGTTAEPRHWNSGTAGTLGTLGAGRLLKRIGRVDPSSLDAYRKSGGYSALAKAIEMGPDRVIAEVTAVEIDGARRRGVSNRTQVGGGRARVDHAALRRLQRGRIRAGHVQGSRADGARSVRGDRSDDDLRDRDRRRARLHLHSRRVSRGGARDRSCDRAGAGGGVARSEHRAVTALRSISRSAAAAAPTFAARRRRCSIRSKASAASRDRSRHFPRSLDCSANRRSSTTSRRWSTCSTSSTRAAPRGRRTGTPDSTGTRLFCLSGHVAKPGLYEIECGRTLREAIELAGGIPNGRALQAILLGGAAGTFVGPSALDMPLSFEGAREAKATLGSGVIMVFDETADLHDTLIRIAEFFKHESCGQCVPCRVGTVRQLEALQGSGIWGSGPSVALIDELGQAMRDASICGLGQTAASAIESAFANVPSLRRPS